MKERIVSIVALVRLRDFCFWVGILALGSGVAGLHSLSLAALVVGSLLFLVAVFGVRATGSR